MSDDGSRVLIAVERGSILLEASSAGLLLGVRSEPGRPYAYAVLSRSDVPRVLGAVVAQAARIVSKARLPRA